MLTGYMLGLGFGVMKSATRKTSTRRVPEQQRRPENFVAGNKRSRNMGIKMGIR